LVKSEEKKPEGSYSPATLVIVLATVTEGFLGISSITKKFYIREDTTILYLHSS
jgi:hypothetical protein